MRAMHRGHIRTGRQSVKHQSHRCASMRGHAVRDLSGLLFQMQVHDKPPTLRLVAEFRRQVDGHGSKRVNHDAHCLLVILASALRPVKSFPPRLEIASIKPFLRTGDRLAEPTCEIARMQQYDSNVCFMGRRQHRLIEGKVQSRIAVMDVVKLTHAGDPRSTHLLKGTKAVPIGCFGRECFDQPIHCFTPRPEIIRQIGKDFAPPTETSLKGVTVRIDKAGHHSKIWAFRRKIRLADIDDRVPINFDR